MPQHRARAIEALLDDWVGQGRIIGGIVLVHQHGAPLVCAVSGWSDREARLPIRRESVLRYASMTKLAISVLALQLVERNVLALDAPVTRWLPDFTPPLVIDGNMSRPAILIRHLLSHTAGLGYGFEQGPDNPYAKAGVSDGLDVAGIDGLENLRRLARVPLFFAPGTGWRYSLATDVLGAVIERATGEGLPALARRIVLAPLGMNSSGFPDAARQPAPAYWAQGAEVRRIVGTEMYEVEGCPLRLSEARALEAGSYPCAGAGMVGTADDYMRLLAALAGGGAPLLQAPSTALLLSPAIGSVPIDSRGPGWSFGLGPVILTDPGRVASVHCHQGAGTWGWCGVHGGHYWVDPVHDLALVALTNTGVTGAWGAFADQLVETIYA